MQSKNWVPIFNTFSVTCIHIFLQCISCKKIYSALIKNGDNEISASTGPNTNVCNTPTIQLVTRGASFVIMLRSGIGQQTSKETSFYLYVLFGTNFQIFPIQFPNIFQVDGGELSFLSFVLDLMCSFWSNTTRWFGSKNAKIPEFFTISTYTLRNLLNRILTVHFHCPHPPISIFVSGFRSRKLETVFQCISSSLCWLILKLKYANT